MERLMSRIRMQVGLGRIAPVVTLLLTALSVTSLLALGGGSGSISLATLGSPYSQNFDTLANTLTTNSLTVNGWYLNETGSSAANNGQYAGGTGSGTGGDVYSFGAAASAERAFGTLFAALEPSSFRNQPLTARLFVVSVLASVSKVWVYGLPNAVSDIEPDPLPRASRPVTDSAVSSSATTGAIRPSSTRMRIRDINRSMTALRPQRRSLSATRRPSAQPAECSTVGRIV